MSRSKEHKEEKTPSARLRAVYYLHWEKNNEGYKDFEVYYASKMEMLIAHYKKLLNKVSK